MAKYRNRTTGEIKSQGQVRKENPNMSLPRVWTQATLDALNIDKVIAGDPPSITAYQIARSNGATQNSDGEWVEAFEVVDMFADDADGTKAEKEAAYQASLDSITATNNRIKRNALLADSDWTQMNDSPLTNEVKTQWAVYRSELRAITDLDAWPNLADDDWPVAP